MKKLNFFKKLGLCALSAALCASAFAFSACDNDKSDDEEQKQEQTSGDDNQGNQGNQGGQQPSGVVSVSEAEWKIATGLDFNYTYKQTSTLGEQSFSMEFIYSNGLTKYNDGERSYYMQKDGDKYYSYRYNPTAQKWEKSEISEGNFEEERKPLEMFAEKFADFTYDGKNSYTCAALVFGSMTLSDIKISFSSDKKISAVAFDMTMSGETYKVSGTLDYSAKTITLPQVSE